MAAERLDGGGPVHFGPAVDEHPVRQLLQQLDLRFLGEVDSLRRQHGALPVAPFQQHGKGRVIERFPAARQIAAAVPVQRAQQTAHQWIGGQPAEVPGNPYGVQQRLLVTTQPVQIGTVGDVLAGGRMPAPDERGDPLAAERGEFQLGEALRGQPVLPYGRGARGDQPDISRIARRKLAQRLPQPLTLALRGLVHPVHEQQPAPVGQHPLGPSRRLGGGVRIADGGQEGGRLREAVAAEPAHGEHEGDPPAQPRQRGGGRRARTDTASRCTSVVLPEPATPHSSTRSRPARACSAGALGPRRRPRSPG